MEPDLIYWGAFAVATAGMVSLLITKYGPPTWRLPTRRSLLALLVIGAWVLVPHALAQWAHHSRGTPAYPWIVAAQWGLMAVVLVAVWRSARKDRRR